ncbi:flagellar protein FliT [Paraburkholderia sp. MMS20-SJTR3]|uniref:Flagellar protein FliT n=1 Tax=Paraburkholderia sejongensis TaxID=2886946 RepID=A0ABS8JU35_9BURK|nr:flagellar protein FliT [Paraburkholderia sp. MMS20-SJTR3]MCC8393249.1 flagellar protein FliT [Paraburkholderia sp. MMS20-SJTR3]
MDAQTDIERIWQLTKAIEQAAAVDEWERAAQLVDERSPLLMALGAQQPPVVIAQLKEIQAIDARVSAAAQDAQKALGEEYQAAMLATRNASQYQRIAQF